MLVAAILGSAMAFIDGTAVNVVLPVMQADLGASVMGAQWIVEAYALFLSSLLLVGGALGDKFGRRRVFLVGVGIFGLASAACGLAADIRQLLIARAVQGIGAAMLTPGSLALVSSAFPPRERGRAIGTWSGATAITTAAGPVLGGWLAQSWTWRAVFWINVPIAAALVLIGLRKVPESRRDDAPPLDLAGAALVTAGLGAVVFGLIESSGGAYAAPRTWGPVVAGVAILILFLVFERRSPHPMMPLDLFRSRAFAGANLITFALYSALGGVMFFLAFDLIQAHGFSPTQAGAAFLPFIVIMFTLSRWSGGLLDRIGPRVPLTVGPAVTALGFGLLAVPSKPVVSYWSGFFPAICIFGLGMAVTVPSLTTVVMNSGGEQRTGLASGVNNAVARLGSLLAVAALGLLVTAAFNRSLDRRLDAAGLASVSRAITPAERLKLGAMRLPAGVPAGDTQAAGVAVRGAVSDAFRLVALAAAVLAASLGGTRGVELSAECRRGDWRIGKRDIAGPPHPDPLPAGEREASVSAFYFQWPSRQYQPLLEWFHLPFSHRALGCGRASQRPGAHM